MNKFFLLRAIFILCLFGFFLLISKIAFKKMVQIHTKSKGKKALQYRKRIYLVSISLTLTSLILIPIFVYTEKKECRHVSPMLYISFFILISLVFGNISKLINILEKNDKY